VLSSGQKGKLPMASGNLTIAPLPRRKVHASLRGQSKLSSESEIVEKAEQIEKDDMKESIQRMQIMQVFSVTSASPIITELLDWIEIASLETNELPITPISFNLIEMRPYSPFKYMEMVL
jgi:hypothetical protein